MNRMLVEIVAEFAIFLEATGDTPVPLDRVVQEQEELSFRLKQLAPDERTEFLRLLAVVAEEEASEERRGILKRLPKEVGLA